MHTKHILIVDDDDSVTEMIEAVLTDEGYVTARAHDGTNALRQIPSFVPDLILLDLMMPLMSGFVFLRQYFVVFNHTVPIIVMSTTRGRFDEALSLGAIDYLEKPFDLDVLVALLRKYLPDQ